MFGTPQLLRVLACTFASDLNFDISPAFHRSRLPHNATLFQFLSAKHLAVMPHV